MGRPRGSKNKSAETKQHEADSAAKDLEVKLANARQRAAEVRAKELEKENRRLKKQRD